jgi:hypothetical protein
MDSPEITYQRARGRTKLRKNSLGVGDYQKSLISPNHIQKKTGGENT